MIPTEEQIMIRDMARAFAAEQIAPHAGEWEDKAIFPADTFKEMGKLGLMGMTVPEEWGGAGLDYVTYAMALEEIAAGDGAVAIVMSGHNSVGCMPILEYGTEAQKERYLRALTQGEMLCAFALTEAKGGSDAGALTTRAVRDDDGYVINGNKQFITTGKNADITLIFAVTNPELGTKGISAFIVPTDTPGYEVVRLEEKMGLNASDTAQLAFNDMRVPHDALLGEEGQGYRIALGNLEGGRIGIASQALGMARAAYEAALAYAQEREAFGKPIIEHQAVAFRLADMATQLEAARQLIWHAAALRSAGQKCLMEASMAKMFSTDMAEQVCSDAMQTLGGYGFLRDFPVERYYRGVRGARIYEGTNDIQKLVIARDIAAD
ncbi:MAG: acyl-CoA dehydrogenase family protein [Alphaproteobacteria bacterium]|jgi:alkylation response protein AidB-like acyl-CoA dehydrogenase|nr:acyl-CoA dehydrogenase family protein [Alphaproteobacteria bacterium]MDP6831422.1 acyl-CoA dehydrogenase family protein [Alphaproteobacteria bacterium]MDP6876517.1 acyl-CoA dehydrogenase family protein [Alphaproteobacteria bacterium]